MKNTIKELRNKTGLSRKEFATKYHISLRSIENWELGYRQPPECVVFLLSKLLEYENN